jgi:hypothetical protein
VEEVEEEAKVAVSVAQGKGLKSHMFADEEKERDALWHARRSAYYASAKYRNDVRRKPRIPSHIPSRPHAFLLSGMYVECAVRAPSDAAVGDGRVRAPVAPGPGD